MAVSQVTFPGWHLHLRGLLRKRAFRMVSNSICVPAGINAKDNLKSSIMILSKKKKKKGSV